MKTVHNFAFLLCLGAFLGGCTNTRSNSMSNSNTANPANTKAAVTSATPVAPADAAPAAFSLATPTEAYKTAYALREKKDVQGLKKVMSKDVMEFFEMMAKEEKKTVDDEIAQMFEKPQAKTAEVRNEKIDGDTATIEYLDEDGAWKPMDFVKEGPDWKMTIPRAEKSAPPK